MKIIEKITEEISSSDQDKVPFYSFEFFPPKTEAGVENLYLRMERMTAMQPIFVDITWGAGGSTKDLTMAISEYTQTYFGTEVLMHLTCTNLTVDQIKGILKSARAAGIQNILALRGDPPKGAINWRPIKDGLNNAIDLVKLIRAEHGDYFCIAVAGFPEGHPYSAPSRNASPVKSPAAGGVGEQQQQQQQQMPPPPPAVAAAGKCTCSIEDIDYLKQKVDSGADFILTQFFYDPEVFLDFMRVCRDRGIACPIIPGIMPIQSYLSFQRMTNFCRTRVPDKVWADLSSFRENDEEVKAYGVDLCIKMCDTLKAAGVPGFHFYTLNLEKSISLILDGMKIKGSLATRRALPWRGSRTGTKNLGYASDGSHSTNSNSRGGSSDNLAGMVSSMLQDSKGTSSNGGGAAGGISDDDLHGAGKLSVHDVAGNRSSNSGSVSNLGSGNSTPSNASLSRKIIEDVRPINWANRPKSYIKRTVTWDEFPNGRWGDGRSPAFGELSDSHFYRPTEGTQEDRLAMWGDGPITPQDIYEVFAKYVEGRIPILPWCETATADETVDISSPLAAFNRAGFLTINSQPAVNGAKSDHPVYGWGGRGGRVYQKAYIEFFTSPELLQVILEVVRLRPHLSLHATNCKKESMHSGAKGVTALTWGVFPYKEILQPTVFDSDTFVVWSEEAFELWTQAWATLYDDETESCSLIYDIHDNYYLVAIIDDEYTDCELFTNVVDEMITKAVEFKKGQESSEASDDAEDF
jgi:methylenetetrahydrofolate reductase (NADPH)